MIRHPLDYLEMIWQKPEATRKKITVFLVTILSVVVIGIWASTLSLDNFSLAAKNSQSAKQPPSPFAALREMLPANPWSLIQSWNPNFH